MSEWPEWPEPVYPPRPTPADSEEFRPKRGRR